MQSWLEFWSGKHKIYVNDRHLQAHYRRIADDLLALLPRRDIDLLDWGCGSALGAPLLSNQGVRIALYDKAPSVQADLLRNFARETGIRVLDDAGLAALAPQSFDVVLINSVLQYLSQAELRALLPQLVLLLRPGGRLLLADIIPPDSGMAADVAALLRSGWQHGYFLAAMASLLATFFSDYRNLRQRLGLTTYRPDQILALLGEFGLDSRQLPQNIGFSRHRLAFEGRKPG